MRRVGSLLRCSWPPSFSRVALQPLTRASSTCTGDGRSTPQAAKLARQRLRHRGDERSPGGVRVDLVLTAASRDRLAAQGVKLGAQAQRRRARPSGSRRPPQAAGGFTVWRSYDEREGFATSSTRSRGRTRSIVKLEVIGHTLQGREIIALKVTKDAKTIADGARPDVLYMSTIHAREWISTEVNRRLLHHFVDNYGKNAEITNLVNTRELWFVPSSRTRTATSTRSTTSGCGGRTSATTTATGRSRAATAST